MNIEEFRQYCLKMKGVTEEFPFGGDVLVFKVMGKMFALTVLNTEFTVNLKCDPELAIELREEYSAVTPGYHMSKKHWNTIVCSEVPLKKLQEWIDHSYTLVLNSLTKKVKDQYNSL
ncbi:MAG TPA: MmcQ/YjbR family DNA-binding protein [Bacteroidales bacterium]